MSPRREPLPSRVRQLARRTPNRPPAPTSTRSPALRPPPPVREPLPSDATDLPPLPDVFHDTLTAGLGELGLALDAAQLHHLDGYVRLLLRWTAAINLTAIRDPEAVARDHLVDSLAGLAILREQAAERILDLGSGGGLPGIPLAIAMPVARVLLVESIGKKAAFLRTAVTAAGLAERVMVAAGRAEDLAAGQEREAWDAVTVRAVAALPELVELAFPLLRVGGRLLAWKREPLEEELLAGRNAARALGGDVDVRPVPVEALAERRLIVVEKTRPTPRRYPRPPAERRARPL
jgi:16S rRNA (guanine527-N7)-methyltransferase